MHANSWKYIHGAAAGPHNGMPFSVKKIAKFGFPYLHANVFCTDSYETS